MTTVTDLPPELLQMVVAHYVKGVGVREVWRHRGINRKFIPSESGVRRTPMLTDKVVFRDYIADEVLGRQPMHAYASLPNAAFLKEALPMFLGYRSFVAHEAPPLLPDLINKIVDKFVHVTNNADPNQCTDWVFKVAEVVVEQCHSPTAYTLATRATLPNNSARMAAVTGETEALVTAVGISDIALVRALLSLNVCIWSKSTVFGTSVLELAVVEYGTFAGNGASFISALLAGTQRGVTAHEKTRQTKILRTCIREAIDHREKDRTAAVLIGWFVANVKHPDDKEWHDWFDRAIESCHPHTVAAMIDLSSADDDYSAFRGLTLGRRRYPARFRVIVKVLLEKRVFSADNINEARAPYSFFWTHECVKIHTQSLLDIAVKQRDDNLLVTLLNAGADPNGVRLELLHPLSVSSLSSPIRRAVWFGDIQIVRLLLERGADPSVAFQHGEVIGTMAGARVRGPIHEILERALYEI
jgi:hypothetical protein